MNILFFLIPKQRLEFLYDNYSLRQALEKMRVTSYTALPVVSKKDGTYVGTVSEGDLLWHILDHNYFNIKDLEDVDLLEIIDRSKYPRVKIGARIEDLVHLILAQNFVPVVDDRDIFMGIVTRRSVIDYFYKLSKDYEQKLIALKGDKDEEQL